MCFRQNALCRLKWEQSESFFVRNKVGCSYFFRLDADLLPLKLGKKINDLFFNTGLAVQKIGIFCAKTIDQRNAKPHFLPNLAQSGLLLRFAGFHMSFGKAAVSPDVADDQISDLAFLPGENHTTAGFFVYHEIILTLDFHASKRRSIPFHEVA